MVLEKPDILLYFKLPVVERDVCMPCFCVTQCTSYSCQVIVKD